MSCQEVWKLFNCLCFGLMSCQEVWNLFNCSFFGLMSCQEVWNLFHCLCFWFNEVSRSFEMCAEFGLMRCQEVLKCVQNIRLYHKLTSVFMCSVIFVPY
jgi:hypothetical protein